MASRAERKRRARLPREVEGWFHDGLFDDGVSRVCVWDFRIAFEPMRAALQKVSDAFAALGAGLAGVFRVKRVEPKQTRRRAEYARHVSQHRVGRPVRTRPSAFRLPRGGERWSERH